MSLPTPDQFLAKLAADPQAAAAFDAATRRDSPGKTRREAVEACHRLAAATLAEIELNKSKLIAARAKIAALEVARTTNARLKSSPAIARGKVAVPSPAPVSLTPLLDSFNGMAGSGRTTFYQKNERAIRLEILRANSPTAITPNQ